MKKSLLLIPSLVATASMPLIGLAGCSKKDPVAKDFSTDSWSTVCFYANQGIDKLHEVYAKDCKNNNFMPGTLIGLERTATLNGEKHQVMVIDEKADTYDKDGSDTPVALTFQFRNLISGGEQEYKGKKMALFINWTDKRSEGAGNYWNSALNNALNGTDTDAKPVKWQNENESFSDVHTSVFQMIEKGESALADNIKLVKRTVATFTEKDPDFQNPKWTTTPGETKLFCPTISNYFSPKGLADSDDGIISEEHMPVCLSEGQTNIDDKQYTYYAQSNRIGDSVIGKNVGDPHQIQPTFDFMVIRDVSGSGPEPIPKTYWSWVGSPWLEDKIGIDPKPGASGERISNISPDGCFCNHADLNDFNAVAPCFCI